MTTKLAPPSGALPARTLAAVGVDDRGHDREPEARRRRGRARARPPSARSARTALRRRWWAGRGRGRGPRARTSSPARSSVTSIGVPSGVWTNALRSRLPSTWRSWSRSPTTSARTVRRAGAISRPGAAGAPVVDGVADERGEVERCVRGVGDLVEARERQQVLDQHAHARRLVLDPPHRLLDVSGLARGAHAEQLGVAADRGERRAQLVRGVGDEAAQAVLAGLALGEGLLEPVEHRVERDAQPADLGARVGRLDAVGEVAAGDRARGVAHAVQRAAGRRARRPTRRGRGR